MKNQELNLKNLIERIYEYEKLENGKTYAAVLINIIAGYDPIKEIATADFIYKAYINPWKTVEVKDSLKFYRCSTYFKGTRRKIERLLDKYNHQILDRDYRNEFAFVNACKCLIGTKVELKPFNYMGEQKYNILATERKEYLDLFRQLENWIVIDRWGVPTEELDKMRGEIK